MHKRKERRGWPCLLGLAGVFLLAAPLSGAQQAPRLDLKTVVEKEIKVQRGGKMATERIPVEKTGPGDVLVYTLTYRNAGNVAAADAAIVNPVPKGTVYRLNSASGSDAEITLSIDNGQTWQKPPAMVQVKKSDGTVEMKPAPPERHTHVRWIIKKPVQPGQSGQLSFKATVR